MSYRRWEVERKVRAHGKNRTWLVLLHKLYHKVAFSLLTKQFPVCSNSVLQTIISEKYFPRKEMGHKFTHTHKREMGRLVPSEIFTILVVIIPVGTIPVGTSV